MFAKYGNKRLGELIGRVEILMSRADLSYLQALLLIKLARLADGEKGGLSLGTSDG